VAQPDANGANKNFLYRGSGAHWMRECQRPHDHLLSDLYGLPGQWARCGPGGGLAIQRHAVGAVHHHSRPLPDGGSTVALLGCALGVLGTFSRRFRK
jgi:hypothetical protein